MDLQAQRRRLLALLKEAGETGPSDEDSKESLRDYSHELSAFDNHPADGHRDYMRNLTPPCGKRRPDSGEDSGGHCPAGLKEYQVCSMWKNTAARLRPRPTPKPASLRPGAGGRAGIGQPHQPVMAAFYSQVLPVGTLTQFRTSPDRSGMM